MSTEFDEEIREFLIESNENLALLDQQIVQLEQQPKNQELISSVFRTIHSVKGTCGFFGFDILGAVTHITESILGQLREQKRELTPELITLILESVDAVKALLQRIEATGGEGDDETEDLRSRLEEAYRSCGASTTIQGMLQEIAASEQAGSEPPAVDAAVTAPVTEATPVPVPVAVAVPVAAPAPAATAVAAPAQVSAPLVTTTSAGTSVAVPPQAAAPAAVSVPVPAPAPAAVIAPAPVAPAAAVAIPAGPEVRPASKVEAGAGLALAPAAAKAASPPTAAAAEPAGEAQLTDTTIRVDVNLLNQLMTLVGELVLTRNQLLQSANNFSPGVQQTSQRLNIITTELQESVMKTRMQPIGTVWGKLPRVVRDLSAKCGKQINLEMNGAETELDKSLIEAIRDPLTHIVRNSCDHGIETPQERLAKGKPATGTLSLRAFHEAGAVNIEIVDDGAGIDPDRVRSKAIEKKLITADYGSSLTANDCINLIFLPGFSTAQQVTSISGRGVGMDVVKTNIEKISGSVQIVCPPTGGTTLRIKIPLTLAIIPGLIIACDNPLSSGPAGNSTGDERFVIPQSHLVEMTRVDISGTNDSVDRVNGALIFRHRGNLLPLVYLSSLLHKTETPRDQEYINIIILQVQGKQFGLVVDRICDTQEIVVKPLGKQLKHLPCYGGATIMGDGRPALILDVGGIAKLAGLDTQHKEPAHGQSAARRSKIVSEFIVFRVAEHHRMALPLTIVNRLEELPAKSVEWAAGQAVVRYRGELLPLLPAAAVVGEELSATTKRTGNLPVIVVNNGAAPFGLIVDDILDIVEESLSAVRGSTNAALLGSAVIGGLVTDIVDATALCERLGRPWVRSGGDAAYTRRVAFYNPWPLGGEMMQTLLDAVGYVPARFSSAEGLHEVLHSGEVDLLIVDPGAAGRLPDWLEHALRTSATLSTVALVELTDGATLADSGSMESSGRRVLVDRLNRAEILRTLQRLMPSVRGKAA